MQKLHTRTFLSNSESFGSEAIGSTVVEICSRGSQEKPYRNELHVLEELLDEAAWGQTKHAGGQQEGDLRVQADVIKRERKLLFYPAEGSRALRRDKTNTEHTHAQYFSAVLTWAVRSRVLWCRLKSWGWWRVAEPLSSTELCRSVRPQTSPFHLYQHITCLLFYPGLFIDLHCFDTELLPPKRLHLTLFSLFIVNSSTT